MSPAQIQGIIRGLYRGVRLLSRSFILPGGSEYCLVEDLILFLIEKQGESSKIQSLLQEVIKGTLDQRFAVQLVLSCHGKPSREIPRIASQIDRSAHRRLAARHLYDYYVRENHNIFAELSEEDWGFVLCQWGTDWMTSGSENRATVQKYVFGLINDKPQYLGQLLMDFIDRSFGQQGGGFRYNDFCQI